MVVGSNVQVFHLHLEAPASLQKPTPCCTDRDRAATSSAMRSRKHDMCSVPTPLANGDPSVCSPPESEHWASARSTLDHQSSLGADRPKEEHLAASPDRGQAGYNSQGLLRMAREADLQEGQPARPRHVVSGAAHLLILHCSRKSMLHYTESAGSAA